MANQNYKANTTTAANGSHKSFPQADTKEIHTLQECMAISTACAKKCIDEGNKKTAHLCHECADICTLTIKAQSCQSELLSQIMDLCAQSCQRCATECAKVQSAHCQECAEVCKRCAECCTSTVHSFR